MWRARESERVGSFGRDVKWLGDHLYIPSIGVLLVVGIWMVIESPAWNFGQFWVLFGLGGIAATGSPAPSSWGRFGADGTTHRGAWAG